MRDLQEDHLQAPQEDPQHLQAPHMAPRSQSFPKRTHFGS